MDNNLQTIIDMYDNVFFLVSILSITFILNGILIYKLCTKTKESKESKESKENKENNILLNSYNNLSKICLFPEKWKN